MRVCFSVGKQSKAICNTLKRSADNIEFFYYSSIQELIKESNIRHLYFERIIFSPSILNDLESDLRLLNDYIKNSSDSSEIIYFLNSIHTTGLEEFNSIFNSPLYTPVILDAPTPKSLLDLVTLSIVEIKAKYYDLDVNNVDSVSVSTSQGKKESVKREKLKPKKKGFISSFFGGGKKSAETKEVAESKSEVEETPLNSGENVSNNNSGFTSGPQSVIASDSGENGSNQNTESKEVENLFGFSESSGNFSEPDNLGAENSSEDEDLSIGDFGSSHSDTGFLDPEDEDEELKKFLEGQNNDSEDDNAVDRPDLFESSSDSERPDLFESTSDSERGDLFENDPTPIPVHNPIPTPTPTPVVVTNKHVKRDIASTVSSGVESLGLVKPVRSKLKEEESILKPSYDSDSPNIDLVTGVDAKKITASIVDESMRLVDEDGIKVLIIDVDTRTNSILSFIDTDRYYFEGAIDGISKQRVYEEDNIGVCSNGYGVSVSPRDLLRLLSSRLVRDYDMVFVCCPLESLNSLSLEVVRRCHVLVMSGGDRSDLIATSIGLTDRSVIDVNVERYIMDNCEVEFFDDISQEDLSFVKKTCLFANGSWLRTI